jgi:hypothetical protein
MIRIMGRIRPVSSPLKKGDMIPSKKPNYPARIRTWTKRAKISCATVTLPGKESRVPGKPDTIFSLIAKGRQAEP